MTNKQTQTQTHQLICQRAQDNLQTLQEHRSDFETTITATQAEHDQARAALTASAEHYQTALSQLQRLENQFRIALQYSQLADGTDAAAETKAASDRFAEQVKAASAERDTALRQKTADSDHEQGLRERLDTLKASLLTNAYDLAHCQDVAAQAHAALGVARHSEALAIFCEYQGRIDALKAELSKLEAEQAQEMDDASRGLVDWGEHHSFVRALRNPSDNVSRVLATQIAYMESLVAAGRSLPKDLNIPSLLKPPYIYGSSWQKQLILSHDELLGINGLQSDSIALREHLDIMRHVAQEWQEHLNTQPVQG
jgi:hypothetical protein